MATYYVDSAGSDANAGTSAGSGNSWLTIQKAADTAVAGDIVYIKNDKSYTEDALFNTNSGTAANPITFIGYNTTTTDGGLVEVNGSNSRAHCFSINGRSHLRFRNLTLTGATQYACDFLTTISNSLSFYNVIFNKGAGTASNAMGSSAGSVTMQYSTVVNCTIDGFTSSGIASVLSQAAMFHRCIFRNNGAAGIAMPGYVDGLTVSHCLFYGNVTHGLTIDTDTGRIVVINNTFANNGNGGTGSGLNLEGSNHRNVIVTGNIFSGHSGASEFGFNIGTIDGTTRIEHGGNAYYNNTTNKASALPATFRDDITLSGDPFTSSSNFSLISTGGGLEARGITWTLDANNISYADHGALQHQDAGGGGGTVPISTSMSGGLQ